MQNARLPGHNLPSRQKCQRGDVLRFSLWNFLPNCGSFSEASADMGVGDTSSNSIRWLKPHLSEQNVYSCPQLACLGNFPEHPLIPQVQKATVAKARRGFSSSSALALAEISLTHEASGLVALMPRPSKATTQHLPHIKTSRLTCPPKHEAGGTQRLTSKGPIRRNSSLQPGQAECSGIGHLMHTQPFLPSRFPSQRAFNQAYHSLGPGRAEVAIAGDGAGFLVLLMSQHLTNPQPQQTGVPGQRKQPQSPGNNADNDV